MSKKLEYPYGSYCDVKRRTVVLPGPSQEEVEKLMKKYSSSPKINIKKIRVGSGKFDY